MSVWTGIGLFFLTGAAVVGCDERADVVMSPDGPIDTLRKAVLAARQARTQDGLPLGGRSRKANMDEVQGRSGTAGLHPSLRPGEFRAIPGRAAFGYNERVCAVPRLSGQAGIAFGDGSGRVFGTVRAGLQGRFGSAPFLIPGEADEVAEGLQTM